jgi:hypothetical protein
MHRLFPAFLVLIGCAAAKPAVFNDLRALDTQQSYRELVGRLKEVPPAQRDSEWDDLTTRAHVALLKEVEVKDPASGEAALALLKEQPLAFPSLKKSVPWLEARATLGIKAFGWTYSNYRHATSDEQWVPQVTAFAEQDPVTKGLAQRLGRDVVLGRLVASSAWPLYSLALTRDGDAVCTDEKLAAVVIDVIDYQSWLDEMKALVTGRCAAQLKGPVSEKLKKNDSKSFRKGACQVLAGQTDVADALKVCE